jgi:hypothetical protein
MNAIMKPVLFRMLEKMKEYPDLNTITLKNVKVYIRPRGSTLVLTVDVASDQQNEQIKNFRLFSNIRNNTGFIIAFIAQSSRFGFPPDIW